MVVDYMIRHWMTVVAATEVGGDVFRRVVQRME